MYSVVLSSASRPELEHIDAAHRFVLDRVQRAIANQVADVTLAGTSDLAWRDFKFSGNSLRCKRTHLLYHGTLLYDFNLTHIGRYLKSPPRRTRLSIRPRSRGVRPQFAAGTRSIAHTSLAESFEAQDLLRDWPRERVATLVAERYWMRQEWHRER